MPKPAKGPRLASGPQHEKLLLSGLAAALIRDERIRTTETKAKRLRPVAERLITLGKQGTVHARRQALSVIEDRDVIHKLFDEVAPRYVDRAGGYTRILKLGPRKGDAAPMALIELIEGEHKVARTADAEDEPKRRRLGRRRKKVEPGAKEGSVEVAEDEEEALEDSTDLPSEDEETTEAATDLPSEDEETTEASTDLPSEDEETTEASTDLPSDEQKVREDANEASKGDPEAKPE